MLTYTFTKREKALLATLIVLLIAIGWYEFVFVDYTNQMTELDARIAETQALIEEDRTKLAQFNKMKEVVERHRANGSKPTPVPDYDNIRQLMAELNGIMAQTSSYSMTFDALDTESTEYVLRGVGMQFSCPSYDAAEGIVEQIAGGSYPCVIDSVSITNTTNESSEGAPVRATVHVVFLERPKASAKTTDSGTGAAVEAAAA